MTYAFGERATSFFALANEMVKCPVEGCNHTGTVITKAHCRMHHSMEREEVKEKFGFPHRIVFQKGVLLNDYENVR